MADVRSKKNRLFEPPLSRGQHLPIDFFFRSLARNQHESAIGIVLSGTGSDGSLGVWAIKGEGGLVIVQDPDTAEHDGMLRSAIATGMVNHVLPVTEMPRKLMEYVTCVFCESNGGCIRTALLDSMLFHRGRGLFHCYSS